MADDDLTFEDLEEQERQISSDVFSARRLAAFYQTLLRAGVSVEEALALTTEWWFGNPNEYEDDDETTD